MLKKINSLNEVFMDELGDLWSAEKQLLKALPKMAEAAQSSELKSAIEEHLYVTQEQVNRLEEIFRDLGKKPARVVCKAMKGLIAEGEDVVHKTEKSAARDAAIIGAAQRVEHYEIAGYGTAESHASLLGHTRVQELLHQTLTEEKETDQKLNDLAESSINLQAKQLS